MIRGDLYRGARLTGALDWAGQHTDELTPTERRFLTASLETTQAASEPPSPGPATRRSSSVAIWADDTNLSSGLYPLDLGTGVARFDPLAFSPNSRLVAVGAPHGTHLVIDTATAQ